MTYEPVEPATSATDENPRHADATIRWMTRATAAGYMDVSTTTIDRWARDGKLTRFKVSGLRSIRFKREELDALLAPEEDGGCDHEEWEHQWEGGKPQVRGDDVWRCANCGCPIDKVEGDELDLICGHTLDLTLPIHEVKGELYGHFSDELNGECDHREPDDEDDLQAPPCGHETALCTH
jgi:excisionase family DNA binding protein